MAPSEPPNVGTPCGPDAPSLGPGSNLQTRVHQAPGDPDRGLKLLSLKWMTQISTDGRMRNNLGIHTHPVEYCPEKSPTMPCSYMHHHGSHKVQLSRSHIQKKLFCTAPFF